MKKLLKITAAFVLLVVASSTFLVGCGTTTGTKKSSSSSTSTETKVATSATFTDSKFKVVISDVEYKSSNSGIYAEEESSDEYKTITSYVYKIKFTVTNLTEQKQIISNFNAFTFWNESIASCNATDSTTGEIGAGKTATVIVEYTLTLNTPIKTEFKVSEVDGAIKTAEYNAYVRTQAPSTLKCSYTGEEGKILEISASK